MNCMKFNKFRILSILAGIFIFLLIGFLVFSCSKPKVYKVGILCGLEFLTPVIDGFQTVMTELGYVEGENITYEIKTTGFDMEVYKNTIKKFVEDKVDCIVTFPTEASMEGKKYAEGTGVPVVFTFTLIEGMGIVASVQNPGGNITGVRFPGPDIAARRFEIMRELVPNAKRYLIPYLKGYPIVAPQIDAIKPLARGAGITIIELPVTSPDEIKTLLAEREIQEDVGIDVIMFVAEPIAVNPDAFGIFAEFAYKYNIPIGGQMIAKDNYFPIFGLNADFFTSGKEAAPLVDKILKGTKAETIPVVSSEMFLEIHTGAAKKLGVTVPEGLLQQASKVLR